MPRFILINETYRIPPKDKRHVCFISANEIRQLVDIRFNPGGYTDVDHCLSMIEDGIPTDKGREFCPFPIETRWGKVTIHVEGRMDINNNQFEWVEAGHRCGSRCLLEPFQRIEKQIFGYQR